MSALLSVFGWYFLPSLVSSWTLTFYYRLITTAGDPIPQSGQPRFNRDYRRVKVGVIAIYLLYTIYEAYESIKNTPNMYNLFSLPFDADNKTIKTRFRRLTMLYHPDKVGSQGEEKFVMIKTAYDTLSNPVKRFAYDRFGDEMLEWKYCSSAYDYLVKGGVNLMVYYFAGGVFLVGLSLLGKLDFGRYWRFYSFFTLLALEAAVITRPHSLAPPLFPKLLQFEQLQLARKIVITTFIAISQLGPLLVQNSRSISSSSSPMELLERFTPLLTRIENLTMLTDAEVKRVLRGEMKPFEDDPKLMKELQDSVKKWLVEKQVRSDKAMVQAVGNVISRQKAVTTNKQNNETT